MGLQADMGTQNICPQGTTAQVHVFGAFETNHHKLHSSLKS